MYDARIVVNPEIRHGKPVIKGTRVPVDIMLGPLAGGMKLEEVARCSLDTDVVIGLLKGNKPREKDWKESAVFNKDF